MGVPRLLGAHYGLLALCRYVPLTPATLLRFLELQSHAMCLVVLADNAGACEPNRCGGMELSVVMGKSVRATSTRRCVSIGRKNHDLYSAAQRNRSLGQVTSLAERLLCGFFCCVSAK